MNTLMNSLDNCFDDSIPKYRFVDYLDSYYNFDDNKEVINSFLSDTKYYTNTLISLLCDISNKIRSLISDVQLGLKVIDGDYYHDNLLGIFVKLSDFEDSYKIDEFKNSLYNQYESYDLDMIHLSLEF